MLDKQKIDELFTRGVGEFIDPDGIFRKKLENNPEKIIIKFGVDPTRPDIHLGHAVVLRKLRQFQDLGCKIVFLIGDYTAQIGDPTGKSKERPEISVNEINSNAETYLKQVGSILDVSNKNKYELLKNSIWYQSPTDYLGGTMTQKAISWEKDRSDYIAIRGELPTTTLWNFMYVLRHVTHAQIIERDMFQKRIKSGEQLFMHELMYPILQGIDSHIIAGFFHSCDLEVGGTDQTFNMLMGRNVMKVNKQEPQAVLAFKILEGLDGKEKMSKSLDNYVGITDEPNDMYGKIMSIPDSSIVNYFELCTFTSMDEIEEISQKLDKNSINPKDIKMELAKQIVEIYHGKEKATQAENSFIKTFQKGEIPEEMVDIVIEQGETLMLGSVKNAIVSSNSEFRRLVEEGAITNLENGEKITDTNFIPNNETKFRIGKKRFVKILVK